MTITLPPRAAACVAELMEAWKTSSPDEAVSQQLVLDSVHRQLERESPVLTEDELAAKLREASKGPYHDYVPGEFAAMVRRRIAQVGGGEERASFWSRGWVTGGCAR